jgi:hypothetical protein
MGWPSQLAELPSVVFHIYKTSDKYVRHVVVVATREYVVNPSS